MTSFRLTPRSPPPAGEGKTTPRVFLVIPRLAGGGAERVIVTYLQHRTGAIDYELVVGEGGGELAEEVPAEAVVHHLGKAGRLSLPAMVWRLRKLIRERRPDAVVSALWYADLLGLLAGMGGKQDSWRHIVTIHSLAADIESERLGRPKRALMERLYPRADRAWCVSQAVADDFAASFARHGRPPLGRIDNPIDLERISALANAEPAPARSCAHRLVAIGRLHPSKGFDVLLEAAALLCERGVDLELWIAGTGPEREQLVRQRDRLQLGDRVHLQGFVENPYPLMVSADVVAAPSRIEALSLVAIECLHLGVPIVGANAIGGLPEVLGWGDRGAVVPRNNAPALADALEQALSNPRDPADGRAYAARHDATLTTAAFEARVLEVTRQ